MFKCSEKVLLNQLKGKNSMSEIKNRLVNGIQLVRPIMVTVLIATTLVLITFISNFTITATVFSEEGGGQEAAAAGLANASIFLGVAIIGGFLIFLLFKYKRKQAIQYLFGGALSLSGGLIIFFFLSILIEDIRYYTSGYMVYHTYSGLRTSDPLFLVFHQEISWPVFIFSIVGGILLCYTILSIHFDKVKRNAALIVMSGMMGAFLAVIMPTWTVMFMLIGLSIYDIYSVKKGPIKNIIDMTEEERRNRTGKKNLQRKRSEAVFAYYREKGIMCPYCHSSKLRVEQYDIVSCLECGYEGVIGGAEDTLRELLVKFQREQVERQRRVKRKAKSAASGSSSPKLKDNDGGFQPIIPLVSSFRGIDSSATAKRGRLLRGKGMGAEELMECLTYSAKDWDLGIGDLVFYSMLVAHSFQYGVRYFDEVGIIAPLIMFLLSMIGIIIGFIITLKMLQRNKILPGLPMSMFIGIFGFTCGAVLLLVL